MPRNVQKYTAEPYGAAEQSRWFKAQKPSRESCVDCASAVVQSCGVIAYIRGDESRYVFAVVVKAFVPGMIKIIISGV